MKQNKRLDAKHATKRAIAVPHPSPDGLIWLALVAAAVSAIAISLAQMLGAQRNPGGFKPPSNAK